MYFACPSCTVPSTLPANRPPLLHHVEMWKIPENPPNPELGSGPLSGGTATLGCAGCRMPRFTHAGKIACTTKTNMPWQNGQCPKLHQHPPIPAILMWICSCFRCCRCLCLLPRLCRCLRRCFCPHPSPLTLACRAEADSSRRRAPTPAQLSPGGAEQFSPGREPGVSIRNPCKPRRGDTSFDFGHIRHAPHPLRFPGNGGIPLL